MDLLLVHGFGLDLHEQVSSCMGLKRFIAGHADSSKVFTRAAGMVCPCNHWSTMGLLALCELSGLVLGQVFGLFGSLRFMDLAHGVWLFATQECASVRFVLGELAI